MKQLLILSGKGGTGKTTIASAFIELARAKVFADCDVDAPNLHLVAKVTAEPQRKDFYGLPKAEIDAEICIHCDRCRENCRFDAIHKNEDYHVDIFACEGCGLCAALCPVKAISMKPAVAGELILYDGDAVFSSACLKMGSGNSGLLVSDVKKQMKKAAGEADLAIIDGSPGIGCPVIASLSGVDMVLIVAEPSLSGFSDMERILHTAAHFQVPAAVCINKHDVNPGNTEKIINYCQENSLPFVGKIPFDHEAVKAVNCGRTIVDGSGPASQAVRKVFKNTLEILNGLGDEDDE
ncbi:MAG: ATP-binding protein [Eubacteriales bacterium]|nr:ATP-binding protein [Eubacteriales bacterium]